MAKLSSLHIQRYLITGFLVFLPLWVTWLVFDFLVRLLSGLGRPWAIMIAEGVRGPFPELAGALSHPWFESLFSVFVILSGLYLLGWFAARVLGRRILNTLDNFLERIPVIKAIYGAARKVVGAFENNTENIQRVVLIDFPSSDMKAIGFVTRIIKDAATDSELAVVYVPTSPNPTSGYMEIVPMEKVTPTDWTLDQAMSFVLTGGTNSPDTVHYSGHGTRPAS